MAHTVQCPSCSTEFPVDPDKVPREGVNARCSSCTEVFFVEKPPEGEEGGVVSPESPVEIPREESLGLEEPGVEVEERAEEKAEGEAGVEVEEQVGQGIEEEAPPEEAGEPAFAESPEAAPPEFSSEAAAPEQSEIAEDDFVLEQETLYTEDDEEVEAPSEEAETGLELEEPPEEIGGAAEEAQAEETPSEETPSGEAPAGLGGTGAAPTGPVQFGQRSPEDKAQRLARVLVSDMILYNPQRHTRAMENGTLAEEFEDEIKKSWEEYVEQVGEDLAEDTSYFTEALNEILAKGEEIF